VNALDEICFLEQQIHDQVRASQEYEGRAVRARMDIKKLQQTLETATKDRTFHENNIRHVKTAELPHVNLNDFAKTKRMFVKAQTTCENAKVGILQAEAVIARCQEEVDGAARRIATMRTKLAAYGEIIEFPGTKES
jgi:polynucleotide 5'-kinase involved in rRNA processing